MQCPINGGGGASLYVVRLNRHKVHGNTQTNHTKIKQFRESEFQHIESLLFLAKLTAEIIHSSLLGHFLIEMLTSKEFPKVTWGDREFHVSDLFCIFQAAS